MTDTPEQVLREYEQLKDELNLHNHRYYVLDDPTVPDSEYDRQMRRLQEIEQQYPQLASPDSPSQRVGGEALQAFTQVTHAVAMLSLDNAFNGEELEAFDRRIKDRLNLNEEEQIEYACNPSWTALPSACSMKTVCWCAAPLAAMARPVKISPPMSALLTAYPCA